MQDKNDILLLVKSKNLYFFSAIDECDCEQVLRSQSPFFLRIKTWFIKYNLPFKRLLLGRWIKRVSQYKLIIFLDFGYEPFMAAYIRKHTDARMILFFWNLMNEERFQLIEIAKNDRSIDDFYTFDPIDAKAYTIKHNSTFYKPIMQAPVDQWDGDVFFGGANKGREEEILDLLQMFQDMGLNVVVHAIGFTQMESGTYIPYPKYLEMAIGCKAILEVMQENQNGVTLRTMESVYFQRKLITTNRSIKNYRLYSKDNIFVIGDDDFAELQMFINTPFVALDPEVVDFFQVSNWLDRFENTSQEAILRDEWMDPESL